MDGCQWPTRASDGIVGHIYTHTNDTSCQSNALSKAILKPTVATEPTPYVSSASVVDHKATSPLFQDNPNTHTYLIAHRNVLHAVELDTHKYLYTHLWIYRRIVTPYMHIWNHCATNTCCGCCKQTLDHRQLWLTLAHANGTTFVKRESIRMRIRCTRIAAQLAWCEFATHVCFTIIDCRESCQPFMVLWLG